MTTPKPPRRGLLADLSRAMDGLASAHLGDYLPDFEKRALLGVAEPTCLAFQLPGPLGGRRGTPRRVALAVQGCVQPGALRYAHQACERMDADLDMVTDRGDDGFRATVDPHRERLARGGHCLEIVRLGQDLLTGILDYASARRGLLFVIVSAEDTLAQRALAPVRDGRRLDVPWVVVTTPEPARLTA